MRVWVCVVEAPTFQPLLSPRKPPCGPALGLEDLCFLSVLSSAALFGIQPSWADRHSDLLLGWLRPLLRMQLLLGLVLSSGLDEVRSEGRAALSHQRLC